MAADALAGVPPARWPEKAAVVVVGVGASALATALFTQAFGSAIR